MQIERVQCLVKLKLNDRNDLSQIVKSGPDAVPATEIPLLRAKHDLASGMTEAECAISMAEVVDVIEISKPEEYERLCLKYGKPFVDAHYPQGRLMPLTLADCELPPGCTVAKPKKVAASKKLKADPAPAPVEDDFDREFWLNELREAGATVPDGNLSPDDIMALVEEAGLLSTAA
jgi:hypothetical protein